MRLTTSRKQRSALQQAVAGAVRTQFLSHFAQRILKRLRVRDSVSISARSSATASLAGLRRK
jgi:hypothetical protein